MAGKQFDNRALILARALELFSARGYDAVGVQEICEAAAVTKPTLYHYFGSKRGVLDALVHERATPLLDDLRDATAYSNDLPLNLQRIARVYFAFGNREPVLYRLLLSWWFAVPENDVFQVASSLNGQQQQLVEAMFAAAAEQHGNMHGRQHVYAATYIGMINTLVALSLNGYAQLDEPLIHQAVQQFSYGIYT